MEFPTRGFFLHARNNVSAGEEVFISYGKRSNDRFFQIYGFLEPDNPIIEVMLSFDIKLDNQLLGGLKSEMLGSKVNRSYLINKDFDCDLVHELLSFLRIVLFDEVKNVGKLHKLKDTYILNSKIPIISKQNEF